MKIPAIIECIKSQYLREPKDRVSLYIEGDPGVGKSDLAVAATRQLGIGYSFIAATIEDPITLSGLPVRAMSEPTPLIHNGLPVSQSARQPLDYAEFLTFRDKLPTGGEGILVIEDLPTAPSAVQAALYSLFLLGKLGSYTLPSGWYVMATGNKQGSGSATNKIPMPLWSRWRRLVAECDLDAWTDWASKAGIHPGLIAFLHFKGECFMTFDPAKPGPYACPRSWALASDIFEGTVPGTEAEQLIGQVGEGPAGEAAAFLKIWRLMIPVEEILANPTTTAVPEMTKPDIAYAIAGALAYKVTPKTFGAGLKYTARMPLEYQVLFVRLASNRDTNIIPTPAFIEWSTKNHDTVMAR